jgi:hypothetical protein
MRFVARFFTPEQTREGRAKTALRIWHIMFSCQARGFLILSALSSIRDSQSGTVYGRISAAKAFCPLHAKAR